MRPSEDMKTHQPSDLASRQASYGGSLRGKFQVGTSIPIPGHRMGMFRMHCRKKSHTHTHTQTHSECTNLTYTTHVSHVPCIIQQSPAKKKTSYHHLPSRPSRPSSLEHHPGPSRDGERMWHPSSSLVAGPGVAPRPSKVNMAGFNHDYIHYCIHYCIIHHNSS